MRLLTLMATAAALVACADPVVSPASRPIDPLLINNGVPTGSSYGAVGALLYDFNADGVYDGDDAICTGSLVSPTVFLTAAHCVNFFPAGTVLRVSFDDDLYPVASGVIVATGYAYASRVGISPSDPADVAVVFLPAGSTAGITPYSLPPANHLDDLALQGGLVGQLFVNVGYGVAAARTGPLRYSYDGVRKVSRSRFNSLNGPWLTLLMQEGATGEGGDCYGDSGGPKFVDGAPGTVVAVVTWGDRVCRATSFDYRVDTPVARAFLGQYVTLP
jgi:hypothetical protein